ncbi:hypothetical protein E2C01_008184 [Portunus trituberculatus]|uniref:Uncharacterized protein n=1 Tax=Portunus trituberculatus TaxID=210409 RepID=A0A5B7D394_PORTR|nr:hypothetical protein [Portunus trituberculatus]
MSHCGPKVTKYIPDTKKITDKAFHHDFSTGLNNTATLAPPPTGSNNRTSIVALKYNNDGWHKISINQYSRSSRPSLPTRACDS